MESLGERLYEIRRDRGLSQEYLAEQLGVSRQTLSKWENNSVRPGEQNLKVMCEVLQVSRDYFFPGSEGQTVSEPLKPDKKQIRVRKGLIIGVVIAGALMLICTCITAVCGIIILSKINFGLSGGGGGGNIDVWALVSGMREYDMFLTSLIIAVTALIAGVVLAVLLIRQRRRAKH